MSPTTHTAADVIACLDLAPLPHEGGWFRRVQTATAIAPASGGRGAWSMIQALFTAEPGGFSALHWLAIDELWIFQAGDPLELTCLSETGAMTITTLGLDVAAGHQPHTSVPAGTWQGARGADQGRWTLVTCVTVPEFRWEDFRLGVRADLLARFPARAADIARLTRA